MATDEIKKQRQLLNTLINKYAFETNTQHGLVWGKFKQKYNAKYKTNLDRSIQSYKSKNKLKTLSVPQYLSITGNLQKAIDAVEDMLDKIQY